MKEVARGEAAKLGMDYERLESELVDPGADAMEEEEPKDKWNVAYMLLFLNGLGQLFPWNVFITISSYFGNRLCDTNYENTFLNFFGIIFGAFNCLGLVLALNFQHRFAQDTRAIAPLAVNSIVFGITTALVLVEPSVLAGPPFFIITLVLVGVSGSCNAVLTGGAFGLAAQLPPIYTGAIMGGQGFAGITVALTALATAIASPDAVTGCIGSQPKAPYSTVKWGAFAYFLVSVVVLVGCLVGYLVLVRLPFVRYHIQKAHKPLSDNLAPESDSPLLPKPQQNIYATFVQVRRMAMSVYSVFALTLMLFPTVTAQIGSTSPLAFWRDTIFVPLSFVNFNFFDFVGRMVAGLFRLQPATQDKLWLGCALRVVFIPLFLLCSTPFSREHGSDVFLSDAWPVLIMVVFATTNGLLSSLLMMYGPSRVAAQDQNVAGTIMVTCLTFGLFSGSCLSFAVAPAVVA